MADDLTAALQEAERRLQAAQLAGDADVLDGLLDDRLIYTGGPDGTRYTKQDDLEIQRSRTQVLSTVEEEDLIVLVDGHTGVTWFRGRLEGTFAGREFTADLNFTRTWIYTPGSGWRLIAAHSSQR
ncbi:nuclear transport factor 2 family protein [Kitasatospora sp. NPDC057015]|uniref:nuclear transport factor 2 family protein n=1 Tax=Kitasatospora sp. NPDC057015 TaxID=3346001 RepID=UPI00362F4CD1